MIKIFVVLLGGFAWAIGGEKYFGKWKRGALLLIPTILWGITTHTQWWNYITIGLAHYFIYQLLFYDVGVKKMFSEKKPLLGYMILVVNGLLIGCPPAIIKLSYEPLISMLVAFPILVVIANIVDFDIPICKSIGEVKILCPQDNWWLACWIIGCIYLITYYI